MQRMLVTVSFVLALVAALPVFMMAQAPNKANLKSPAALKEQAPPTFKAKFDTSAGVFVVEVTRAWAPNGADRFYNLVKNGFYDNAGIFRVLPGFVVQFGIAAQPAVAKTWSKATIPDDPVTQSNRRGYLTFATAGANTRTTQVFINLGDNAALDKMGFAPFGKVVEGMKVVDSFYSGYGEGAPSGRGPDQSRLTNEGKAYLDRDFPRLKTTLVQPVAPPAESTAAHKETK
jgi:peptidyl-prolyl cis-trans isomerase A (cyclophilin A)